MLFFSGLVPLHNACSYGHYEVTELLVKHGASVNVADLWKFTPLHEAAAKGKYEIVRLLLKVCHRIVSVFLMRLFMIYIVMPISGRQILFIFCHWIFLSGIFIFCYLQTRHVCILNFLD
jgi:hypothetical protein